MINFKLYLILILTLQFCFSLNVFSCEIDIYELAKKTDVSEKFTKHKFIVKSGNKWFYISQDDDCWINVRYVNSFNKAKNYNTK